LSVSSGDTAPRSFINVNAGAWPSYIQWTLTCGSVSISGGAPYESLEIVTIPAGQSCSLWMNTGFSGSWRGASWSGFGITKHRYSSGVPGSGTFSFTPVTALESDPLSGGWHAQLCPWSNDGYCDDGTSQFSPVLQQDTIWVSQYWLNKGKSVAFCGYGMDDGDCKKRPRKCPPGTLNCPPGETNNLVAWSGGPGYCKNNNRCPAGGGECTKDSHCMKGLKCFKRNGNQAVPGMDVSNLNSGTNVCYDPAAG